MYGEKELSAILKEASELRELDTDVIVQPSTITEILNYAMWARAGEAFFEEMQRSPKDWNEFTNWYKTHYDPVRILEIGCGSGYISHLLAERGAKVVGIDPVLNLNLEHPHADTIKMCYLHPNLILLAEKLSAIERDIYNDGFEGIKETGFHKDLSRKIGRIKEATAKLRERIGEIDLILSVWMAYGINLTPAIREFGANGIYYIKSKFGGTGCDFGEYGALTGSHRLTLNKGLGKDIYDMLVSFTEGIDYVTHRTLDLDGAKPTRLCPQGIVQFRKTICVPEFELPKKENCDPNDFRKIARGMGTRIDSTGFMTPPRGIKIR